MNSVRKSYSIKENFFHLRSINDILLNNKLIDDDQLKVKKEAEDDENDVGGKMFLKSKNY